MIFEPGDLVRSIIYSSPILIFQEHSARYPGICQVKYEKTKTLAYFVTKNLILVKSKKQIDFEQKLKDIITND